MEILQLRYFLTVARMLNISRAAAHHMIPQPAMSQTISRLEKELGKKLFDREKNKLTLTQEGRAFYRSVSESVAELDRAVQGLHNDSDVLQGEITLLVRQHRGTVVNCIVAFRKIYPRVSFRVFYSENSGEGEDYDMCISSTPPSDEYSNQKRLITERLLLLVSADHILAKRKSVSIEELKNEEFAFLNKNNSLWSHTLHLCREAGFEPKISMICEDLHCMLRYVTAGMAVTVGPELSWRGVKSDDAVFVPLLPEDLRSTYVFWKERKIPSNLHQTFLDFLLKYFSDQAP